VTSRSKGYPFEVHLPAEQRVSGVVLADHLKSADWRARRAEFAGKAPDLVLAEISAKLRALLTL
jgi:mRNA interferase MazF